MKKPHEVREELWEQFKVQTGLDKPPSRGFKAFLIMLLSIFLWLAVSKWMR